MSTAAAAALAAVRLLGGGVACRLSPQPPAALSLLLRPTPQRCRLLFRGLCSSQPQPPPPQLAESFWQRLWRTYKTQTKVVLGVHIAGSVVWFSGLYRFAGSGVDLPAMLQRYLPTRLHSAIPQSALDTLANPSVGAIAATLVMYKLLFPVRDLCTLLLTPPTLAVLRRLGFISQLRAEDRLRNITREKGRETYQKLKTQQQSRVQSRKARDK